MCPTLIYILIRNFFDNYTKRKNTQQIFWQNDTWYLKAIKYDGKKRKWGKNSEKKKRDRFFFFCCFKESNLKTTIPAYKFCIHTV